ncbi:fibrillin-2-like [Amphibalanus amphitrite]|uniref:fibrillin-2-like n=1 Tax=Amphibalanus amphitrite TaxID=1232801 RepID=UPI001C92A46E|nr:fibrillin-2-like [Amphibalanus amphitrite]
MWLFKCQCPSAWTGQVCQKPLDPCGSRATGARLCGAGFTCSRNPESVAGYRCNCRNHPGYAAKSASDPRCIIKDRCKAKPPCQNGGTCTPSAESGREYTCTCSPAWRGRHCEEPNDPCTTALNRCGTGWKCRRDPTHASGHRCGCSSKPGWTMKSDTDPSCVVADACAARRPCQNGATCRRRPGTSFSCLCPPAWSGRLCQLARDPCPSQRDVCGAGFNCTRSEASPAGFTCQCRRRPGWARISASNPQCHIQDICQADNPCANGGTCTSRGGTAFECACPPAWQGERCTEERNPCSAGATLCQPSFACSRDANATLGYVCDCSKPGWRPLSASNPRCVVADVCLARRPCLNGGTCSPRDLGQYTCRCGPAWSGDTCQLPRNPCTEGQLCGVGFLCSRDAASPAGYACNCRHRPGWGAKSDSEPGCVVVDHCVASSPCENGGTCSPHPGGYNCSCPGAWSGPQCAHPADPCTTDSTTALCGASHWNCVRDANSSVGYNCSCEERPGWAAISESEPRCRVVDPCLARQPCQNGGTCSWSRATGTVCQCPPAWQGAACDQEADPCKVEPALCGKRGNCSRDASSPVGFSCGCNVTVGYSPISRRDPRCRISDICQARSPCLHGGSCRLAGDSGMEFVCRCTPPWQGVRCQLPRDPCRKGGGQECAPFPCRRDEKRKRGFRCLCNKLGYKEGSDSKPACVVSDVCLAKQPCKNRGTCTVVQNRAVCSCTAAWRGDFCQLPAQPCGGQADPCGEDFRCSRESEALAGFSCNCHRKPGWTAKSEKDPRCVVQEPCLALRPCKNGGTCQVTATGWSCSCPPAWQGERCRQPRDPCLQKPPVCGDKRWGCRRAPDKPAGFVCDCNAKGWGPKSASRPQCVVVDACLAENPCHNGGTCSGGTGGLPTQCQCSPAWTGKRCTRPNDPCAGQKPCGKAWQCTRDPLSPAGYSCGCDARPGYKPASESDPHCIVSDMCLAHRPCHHGGTCTAGGGKSFSCRCPGAWSGSRCQNPADPCSKGQPCGAGWTCARDTSSKAGFNCGCDKKPGYMAKSANDPVCRVADVCLAREPCQNGATCQPMEGDQFKCLCRPAWTGTLCTEVHDPCSDGGDTCGEGWNCSRDSAAVAGYTCGCDGKPGWKPKSAKNPVCVISDICLARTVCKNGGKCHTTGGGGTEFRCTCPPAWGGATCSDERDPCQEESPCGRFGCERDANTTQPGYRCKCSERPGYRPISATNRTCELWNVCAIRNHCSNGGVCSPASRRRFRCRCPPAWRGPRCRQPADPCLTGGAQVCGSFTCERDPGAKVGYTCHCERQAGYKAQSASKPGCVESDACLARQPCTNGGTCRTDDSKEGFSCACPPAWRGATCADPADPCRNASAVVCARGWRCSRDTDSVVGYNCGCDAHAGWNATSASDPKCAVSDMCLAARDVCHHGGTCTSLGGRQYRCDCHPAWRGKRCSFPSDPCASDSLDKPCGAKWKCSRDPSKQLGYNCSCTSKPGWRATSKSDPRCVIYDRCLAEKPCLNGGSCSPRPGGGFVCACRPAWSGVRCAEPRDPCDAEEQMCGKEWRCERDPNVTLGFSCGCGSKPGWRPAGGSDPRCTVSDICLAKSPCQNGGTCQTHGEGNYTCSCSPAWVGKDCTEPQFPCAEQPNPCGGDWPCQREPESEAGLSCNCHTKPGYVAKSDKEPQCIISDVCQALSPCKNGGTCQLKGNGTEYGCQCLPAWTGEDCEREENPCDRDTHLCGPGWQCGRNPNKPVGYTCGCNSRPGWRAVSDSDPRCEVSDACLAERPCQNGGVCTSRADQGYSCKCPPAWRGRNCTGPAQPCEDGEVDCGDGFQCSRNVSSPVGYSCNCADKPGWKQHSAHSPRCVLFDACLAGQPCENGGTCTPAPAGAYTCKCTAAWTGTNCSQPNDICATGASRCGAEWTCERDTSRPSGYNCGCDKKPGWKSISASEPQCQVADPCIALQPCRNGATCLATASDTYRCTCHPAWTGATCDQPLDPCTPAAPCGAGFQCSRDPTSPAGYTCGCDARPGWGVTSDEDPHCAVQDQCLANSPCQNGGTCVQGSAHHYQCECPHAWGGTSCELPRDPCETQRIVCGAGRTCSRDPASVAGYSCNCHTTPGWKANSDEDPTCVVDDVCLARSPCLNDGVCTSLEGGQFKCSCRGLWRGATCSEPRHPCREKALCGKRFACQLAPHSLAGYTCNCDAVPGYGPKSESDPQCVVTDVCLQRSPCQNGGSCTSLPHLGYSCSCTPAWTGKECNMPANPCEGTTEDLCGGPKTVGSCQRNPNSALGFSCGCSKTPGWEAKSDTDPHCIVTDQCLAKRPCKNGATCVSQERAGYTCTCPPAWTGTTCEEPSSPCSDSNDLCGEEFTCARDPDSELGYSCGCDAKPGYERVSDSSPRCHMVDACLALQPCQNGATCLSAGEGQFNCSCAVGWGGPTCTQQLETAEAGTGCDPADPDCNNSVGVPSSGKIRIEIDTETVLSRGNGSTASEEPPTESESSPSPSPSPAAPSPSPAVPSTPPPVPSPPSSTQSPSSSRKPSPSSSPSPAPSPSPLSASKPIGGQEGMKEGQGPLQQKQGSQERTSGTAGNVALAGVGIELPPGGGQGQSQVAGSEFSRLQLLIGQLQQVLGGRQLAAGQVQQLQQLQRLQIDQKSAAGESEADATVGNVVSPNGRVAERVGVAHSDRKTAAGELETVSAVEQPIESGDDGEETEGEEETSPAVEKTVVGPGDQLVSVKQKGPIKVQYYVGPAPSQTAGARGGSGSKVGAGGRSKGRWMVRPAAQPAVGSAAVGVDADTSGGGAPPAAGAVVQLPGSPRLTAAAGTGPAPATGPVLSSARPGALPAMLLMRSGRRRRRQRRHALTPGRTSNLKYPTDKPSHLVKLAASSPSAVKTNTFNFALPVESNTSVSYVSSPTEGEAVAEDLDDPELDPLDPPLPPGVPPPDPPFPPERSAEAARWRRMAVAEKNLSFGQYLVLAIVGFVSAGLVTLVIVVVKVVFLESWHPEKWSQCCPLLLEL